MENKMTEQKHTAEPWPVYVKLIDGSDNFRECLIVMQENYKRARERVNECAGLSVEEIREAVEMRKSYAVKDAWYQLNQVRKEFEKYGTLGQHRLGRIKEALALFPKTTEQKDGE